jgi:uronate dehydrogenase
MTQPFQTLVLTGAAGTLGRQLVPGLLPLAQCLVASDLPQPLAQADLPADVRRVPCDLADAAKVLQLLSGADAVVHLGGVAVEGPFEPILQANIRGVQHLYEAARRCGVKRIVFASSNHVTGCYGLAQTVHPQDPPRPDGHYGLSKLYGEGMARLYWDRFGLQTVCLRIGTATPAPADRRALATWISPRDLLQLVHCALSARDVGFIVAYGISANTRRFHDTTAAWQALGFAPLDNAERFAAQVEHVLLPEGPQRQMQGGSFLGLGPFDHPVQETP